MALGPASLTLLHHRLFFGAELLSFHFLCSQAWGAVSCVLLSTSLP